MRFIESSSNWVGFTRALFPARLAKNVVAITDPRPLMRMRKTPQEPRPTLLRQNYLASACSHFILRRLRIFGTRRMPALSDEVEQ
jgi:hypothetical protein